MDMRFINLEKLARHCAQDKNTLTIIINNGCRLYPKGYKAPENIKFMEEDNFKIDMNEE